MRKWSMYLLALVLVLSLAVPARAALEYKQLYDATECFDRELCWDIGANQLVALSDAYETQIRVDIVSDTEEYTLEEYAEIFYTGFEYGYKDTQDGILLMLLMQPDDTGVALKDYTVYCGGKNQKTLEGFLTLVEPYLAPWLDAEVWAGDMEADDLALQEAMQAYMDCAAGFLSGVLEPIVPEVIVKYDFYVVDDPDLLTPEEWKPLEDIAKAATLRHDVGVYIAIIEDFTADGSATMAEAAEAYYKEKHLGRGQDKDGVLLLISRAEGDYIIFPQGSAGQWFGETEIGSLSDILLDRFAAGKIAKGLEEYLAQCDAILSGEVVEPTLPPVQPQQEENSANVYFPIVLIISAALLLLILREGKRSKRQ